MSHQNGIEFLPSIVLPYATFVTSAIWTTSMHTNSLLTIDQLEIQGFIVTYQYLQTPNISI